LTEYQVKPLFPGMPVYANGAKKTSEMNPIQRIAIQSIHL